MVVASMSSNPKPLKASSTEGPVKVSNGLIEARFALRSRTPEVLTPQRADGPSLNRFHRGLTHRTIHAPIFPVANGTATGNLRLHARFVSFHLIAKFQMKIRKAVFPVAGLGTRVLPA